MNEDLIEKISQIVIEEINNMKNIQGIDKKAGQGIKVKVGVSARHVHLSKKDLEILFGQGYELTVKKMLMGEQYAAEETVTIVGPKLKSIEKVRVLGPIRSKTQVEISSTDSIFLGAKAPVRLSGDIKDSAAITIVGPKGSVRIEEGCIVAKRHIHMQPEDVERFGIYKGVVSVRVDGERAGIFENVNVRVGSDYGLEMHIDTDEANALGIKSGQFVEILE